MTNDTWPLFCTKHQTELGWWHRGKGDDELKEVQRRKVRTVSVELEQENVQRQLLFEIAKEHTEEKGWPWLEPAEITEVISIPHIRLWEIRTNIAAHGRSVRILVAVNGPAISVVESGYIPR